MGNNTEVIFDNIEQRILEEIKNAHYAIFVSVAWFTNKKLFQALLEKAKDNCYISIIIQLDDINSQCGIDYSQIQVGRSECFMISKDSELLHDKFCVIDFRKVITGSYNWTYKASHNSENVIVLNDPSVATQYISRFEQQKTKFVELSIQQKPTSQIVSSNFVEAPKVTEVIKQTIVTEIPSQPKYVCKHCKRELECNDSYCRYCGTQQKEDILERGMLWHRRSLSHANNTLTYKVDSSGWVICRKCSHRQATSFLDTKTHFCSKCGYKLKEIKEGGLPIGVSLNDNYINRLGDTCPLCFKISDKWKYCPDCGLPKEITSDKGSGASPTSNRLRNIRPEFHPIEQYQKCDKCDSPNPFGAKYCRCCGENIALHAKDKNGHGWVDLGLSVLWSTETMIGFYRWMDTKCYPIRQRPHSEDDKEITNKDIAILKWGNKWRIPTKEEFEELIEKCKWEKVIIPDSNKHALKVTGPNGNHILLPTTGYAGCTKQDNEEAIFSECRFWTSTKSTDYDFLAFSFRYIGYRYKEFETLSENERKSLWLSTPLERDWYGCSSLIFPEVDKMYISSGCAIRPVVDKHWQGYI